MVILDGTVVNVALPTIRGDLGFTDAGLAWVVNAFFVAFALLLLPAGRLADIVGQRRVFLAGLVVFTAASALCGLAPGPELLVAARFLQRVGGGARDDRGPVRRRRAAAYPRLRPAGLRRGSRCLDRRHRWGSPGRAGV